MKTSLDKPIITSGLPGLMPPLWGLGMYRKDEFYRDCAPLALAPDWMAARIRPASRRGRELTAAQRASLAEMDTLFASLQHWAFRGEL